MPASWNRLPCDACCTAHAALLSTTDLCCLLSLHVVFCTQAHVHDYERSFPVFNNTLVSTSYIGALSVLVCRLLPCMCVCKVCKSPVILFLLLSTQAGELDWRSD